LVIGSFQGVKRAGRGVDHPPPSSAEVNERVELNLYSPSGPSWPVPGWTIPLPIPFVLCACNHSYTPTYDNINTSSPHMSLMC